MFNVGDTVQLKSGGPIMTVKSIDQIEGVEYADCVWFDGKNEVQHMTFPTAILEIR